jgi:hypothetical protein
MNRQAEKTAQAWKNGLERAKTMDLSCPPRMPEVEGCTYDPKTEAIDSCDLCLRPLCSSCGYTIENIRMCNECYLEAVCQNCGELREPEYEHLGEPEYGHMEHVGYKQCTCNWADL